MGFALIGAAESGLVVFMMIIVIGVLPLLMMIVSTITELIIMMRAMMGSIRDLRYSGGTIT